MSDSVKIHHQPEDLNYLRSTAAIRERCEKLFAAALNGKTHFAVNLDKLAQVAERVVAVTRAAYPTLEIPFHSRWNHFRVGGVDRVAELDRKLAILPADERARCKLDLALVSVLLDAGAGMAWRYQEAETGKSFSKSEGLAVASYHLFLQGAFSSDPSKPLQVDADGLKNLRLDTLLEGFQVSDANPLVGAEGRWQLLRKLGEALAAQATGRFGPAPARPGHILDQVRRLSAGKGSYPAPRLLFEVLDGLGSIWPGRIQLGSVNLGDAWHHPLLGEATSTASIVPFHKLSQWLTLSLIEPIEEAGIRITDVNGLTGLPEYRNGGLFIDTGVISLRDPALLQQEFEPGSLFIIEWRALTVCLLDRIAPEVRKLLGKPADEFPLAKVLEGGTWATGRKLAAEHRADGGSPIRIRSDGTVF
jgi:hypothetical protein